MRLVFYLHPNSEFYNDRIIGIIAKQVIMAIISDKINNIIAKI